LACLIFHPALLELLSQLSVDFYPYFYFIVWSETTMPTIFRREVVDLVEVIGILERAGA
jgi:hypothetical protein